MNSGLEAKGVELARSLEPIAKRDVQEIDIGR